jgi:hypothetical protein
MTQNSGLGVMHIFQLGTYISGVLNPLANNSFSNWWNTAPGSGSNQREGQLNYLKSLMVSGMGRLVGSWNSSHITVDYDPNTGKERAIVFTRNGNDSNIGSITRVPWVE